MLTLFNRHYLTPPPSTSELLATRPRDAPGTQPLRVSVSTAARPISLDPEWPNFGGLFRSCEQRVLRMRDQLLGSRIHRLPRSRAGVLANSLTAQVNWIDPPTAAALGWSISWTTASSTLVADCRDFGALPALGLAAWLARIPFRPAHVTEAQWQAQVIRWLDDDLALSSWLWSRLAQFMHDQGHFVLRTLVSHPEELAAPRVRG